MTTPTTIKAEYLRATAAEKALSDRIYALEHPPTPPVVVPPPVITPPPSGQSVKVSSITDLLAARQNLATGEVILANGTYRISWLDLGLVRSQAAPVLIRAETDSGVILDLQGSSSPHFLYRNGCAWEEWRGFAFGNSHPGDNGVVMFGESAQGCHDLKLTNIEFLSSISTGPGPNGNYQNGQGLYFSWSTDGNHDIIVDGFLSSAALWSQVHVYHDTPTTGRNITVRNAVWNLARQPHAQMGIVAWSSTMAGYLFEDITINGANEYGVRHASGGTATFRRVKTTGSGVKGIYSSLGTYPSIPGLTFDTCSFA